MADISAVPEGARQRPRLIGLTGWVRRRGVFVLVGLGPILALATGIVLSQEDRIDGASTLLRGVLLADLCYILALGAVIAWQIGRLIAAARQRSIGTQLHLRLTGVFAVVALVPAVIVAVFATLTLNFGMESWFSERIGSVVRNSLATAQAYEREHRGNIRGAVLAMANDLNRAASQGISQAQLNELVAQQALLRELPEAYVFNLDKRIVARGEFSYLFSFEPPTEEQIARARSGETVIMEDDQNNEIRALVYLTNYFDMFLYVSRAVQGNVLRLLDDTRATVKLYEQLERERDSILLEFALVYLGFALLVIMAAILLGLWFAERLAQPVGRLAAAAEQVGSGNLDIRVKEERGTDEIAVLSRVFNRMTGQLKGQRDDLMTARDVSEQRRGLMEAVLSGVTAGVIGIDGHGRIDLMNEAAVRMLGLDGHRAIGGRFADVAPAFAALMARARGATDSTARGEVSILIGGQKREFLCRIAPRTDNDLSGGAVVTFDDMTALVAAQRMAAWGDVARRIAHEIKNPLTPIQLSADRMRRKFVGRLEDDGPKFEQLLDVITRQAGDIRRMVDEFSRFARMPEPSMAREDLTRIVREAVLLQREAGQGIDYRLEIGDRAVEIVCDRGLITQCLTNLLKNAAEAIEARSAVDKDVQPGIAVFFTHRDKAVVIDILDTGIGLPDDRARVFEPYVTTRAKGTGLGLAIVRKIVEQHGGDLVLGDAPPESGYDGARVTVRLPIAASGASDETDRTNERT